MFADLTSDKSVRAGDDNHAGDASILLQFFQGDRAPNGPMLYLSNSWSERKGLQAPSMTRFASQNRGLPNPKNRLACLTEVALSLLYGQGLQKSAQGAILSEMSDTQNTTKRRLFKALLLGLAIISLQSIPSAWTPEKMSGEKTVDDYWKQSDLSEADLQGLLRDENCLSSQIKFLACVNAINTVADRVGLFLQENGKFRILTGSDFDLRLTEKAGLQAWTDKFNSPEYSPEFRFLDLWEELKPKVIQEPGILPAVAAGINGYLSIAEDPHSYIVPLAFYEDVLSQSDSNQFYLGFVARRVRSGALIRKVFSKSPAARSGLKKGDRVKRMNGLEVNRMQASTYSEMIRGQSRHRLLLEIERAEKGQIITKTLEIIKGDFEFSSVESRVVNMGRNIGLLTIHKFGKDTCARAKKHLSSLIEQSVEGVLLDLRDNPGGQVDESACVLNLFVEKNTVLFETRYLDPLKLGETYIADQDPIYLGPLAVLINAGSASASEIVAGAIKDLGRGTLVGERSFGKGSFQDGNIWKSHQRVALFRTKGFYYFPSGWTPQLVGLEPDIFAANSLPNNDGETLRERDLYYTPLRPNDLWSGPQTLNWLFQNKCTQNEPLKSQIFQKGNDLEEDPQIQMASDWFKCELSARADIGNGFNESANQGL